MDAKYAIYNITDERGSMPWKVRPSPCSPSIKIHYFMERFVEQYIPDLSKNQTLKKISISSFRCCICNPLRPGYPAGSPEMVFFFSERIPIYPKIRTCFR